MLSFLTGIFVLVLTLNVVLYFKQPYMVYIPVTNLGSTPADWGYEFEDVLMQTDDGVTLHGWFIPASAATNTLLFFHGNAGNISHRRESIKLFLQLNLNVFIVDYRGFGKSTGQPSEQGTYADAATAWDYLVNTRNLQPSEILVFGRSLGSAIATHLAVRSQPAALIVESPFSSARDMASIALPFLSHVVLLRFDYDTAKNIREVNCPVLVIHSKDDELIPYRQGLKVYDAAKPPKSHLVIRGGHNDGFYVSGPLYTEGLRTFLATHVTR